MVQINQRVLRKVIGDLRATELELEGELLAGVTHSASITGRFEEVSHERLHGALANVRSAIVELEAVRELPLAAEIASL